MWKKEEAPAPVPAPRAETPLRSERSAPAAGAAASTDRATIGRSITIRGDVTGDEDLVIQGRVEGSVDLKQHAVTVGAEGQVKASITGRVVVIEGKVVGNVTAHERIVLRSTASVQGDISAPRVVLEDGARFRGGVDMTEAGERGSAAKGANGVKAAEPVKAPAVAEAAREKTAR